MIKNIKFLLGENVIDYLNALNNTLNIYNNFQEIVSDINDVDNNKIEILNYCYNKTNNKEELISLLSLLPELKLLKSIEEDENKYNDVLYLYKDYSIIVDEIKKSESIKNIFIGKLLKKVFKLDESFFKDIKYIMINSSNYNKIPKELLDIVETNYINESDNIFYLTNNVIKDINSNNFLDITYNLSEKNIYNGDKYKFINGIIDFIDKIGCKYRVNYMYGKYIFPIVIYNNEKIVLAIDFDESIYNLNYNLEYDDIYKSIFLDKSKVSYLRLWSRDWYLDSKKVLKNIEIIIKDLLQL
ncbi:hypothetical protein JCM1393_26990 [Clostridium carnis]